MESSKSPARQNKFGSAPGIGPGMPISHVPEVSSSALDTNRIFEAVLQHQSNEPGDVVSTISAQIRASLREQAGRGAPLVLPPLGRVPTYNPAMDTREGFDLQLNRLSSQLESLRNQGALEHELLAFQLERQAELDQLFPKQALRQRAEENLKAVGLLLKKNGVPHAEIRKYLKRKAAAHLMPTAAEIKTFIESRKQFAARIAAITLEAGYSAPRTPTSAEAVRTPAVSRSPVQSGAQPQGKFSSVALHKP